MAFGGFNQSGPAAPMAEINMVPLIDVMLVLLVIFILTAPLLTHAVKVELPRTSSVENQMPPERIEIGINADSEIFWDGEKIDLSTLESRMQAKAAQTGDTTPAPEISLRADKATPYEMVAKALAVAARAKLTKIAFVSQPD